MQVCSGSPDSAPPPPPGDIDWGILPGCDDPTTLTCGPGNGDGNGGSNPDCDDPTIIDPPAECEEPDPTPCNTSDSLINTGPFQSSMLQTWLDSYGPEADPFDHDQRNEGMVIVTATSSGYEFETVPAGPNTSSCHFDAATGSLPSNIVAIIHTHPYSHNDVLEDPRCPSTPYLGDSVSAVNLQY